MNDRVLNNHFNCRWYNNKDVLPFLVCLRRQSEYFQKRGLDLAKDGISLPGLALKDLFANCDAFFSLPENEDQYRLIKSNIVGGPSDIFHRYHMKGVTKIREEEFGEEAKVCQVIVGEDANGLYLGCVMKPQPTGLCTIWRANGLGQFKAERSHKYGGLAHEWLSWYEHNNGVDIIHKYKQGQEHRVGARNIPVDGYIKSQKKVLQFQGCLFHGHQCHLTRDYRTKGFLQTNPVNKKSMADLRNNTRDITDYIKSQGYEFEEIYECEWLRMKSTQTQISAFITKRCKKWTTLRTVSEKKILDGVKSGKLFGMVECDVRVPDDQRAIWTEMPPIFKNVEVGRDDIGDFSRQYAEEHDLLKTPRRMLIGSMFAKKTLFATPLLKYYLEKGFEVTNVTQVLEYEPKACFKAVGERVCQARRDGDADPEKAIIAEMEKLMGNR